MSGEIYSRALTLLGGTLSNEEQALLRDVCAAVQRMLTQTLRAGVTPEDCSEPFSVAAALLAAEVTRSPMRDGLQIFDAGTMRLHFADGPAGKLARQLLAPWLDGGVCFRSVAT